MSNSDTSAAVEWLEEQFRTTMMLCYGSEDHYDHRSYDDRQVGPIRDEIQSCSWRYRPDTDICPACWIFFVDWSHRSGEVEDCVLLDVIMHDEGVPSHHLLELLKKEYLGDHLNGNFCP